MQMFELKVITIIN